MIKSIRRWIEKRYWVLRWSMRMSSSIIFDILSNEFRDPETRQLILAFSHLESYCLNRGTCEKCLLRYNCKTNLSGALCIYAHRIIKNLRNHKND